MSNATQNTTEHLRGRIFALKSILKQTTTELEQLQGVLRFKEMREKNTEVQEQPARVSPWWMSGFSWPWI